MEPLILIAEDEAEIADILDAYLARDGFRTIRAENGRVTLDLHLALRPDLVLLDIKTIMWSNRSTPRRWWRAFAPCCAGRRAWALIALSMSARSLLI